MERSLLWILTGLAPISAYALAPVVPASVGAVALIAATVFAIRTTFERSASWSEEAGALALVWLALALRATVSLVLSTSTLSNMFSPSSDIIAAVSSYMFAATMFPMISTGLLVAAVPARNPCSFTRILLPGLVIAFAGLAYEHVSGVGRMGWYVCAAQPGYTAGLEWAQRGGGPVLVDLVVGASAFALAEFAWIISTAWANSSNSPERAGLLPNVPDEENAGAARAGATEEVLPSAGWQTRRTRFYSLLYLAYARHFRVRQSPYLTSHGGHHHHHHHHHQQQRQQGARTQPAATGGKYGAHDRPLTPPTPQSRVPAQSSLPRRPSPADSAHCISLRSKAVRERDLMEQAFMAGRQARAAKAVAKARGLITKGKTHQRNRDQLNAEAAQYIFDENNKVQPAGWVDLHGLHVHEAIKFTQQAIEDSRARGLPELRLIVGKGHHSLSRIAKIKPAVSSYMQRKQLTAQVDQHNAGVLVVQLQG